MQKTRDDAATPTSATTQPQLSGGALRYLLTLILFYFHFTLANYSGKYFTKKEMYSNSNKVAQNKIEFREVKHHL